jgi:predicted component of type VI protein secretion system
MEFGYNTRVRTHRAELPPMAYLVFSSHKGEEIGRRRLEGPVTIGRSPDCDVSLHDHLLSRHHCRLAPGDDGWVLSDLGSKNGTVVHGKSINQPQTLHDGESFNVGRGKVRFREGALAPGQEKTVRSGRPNRPADPFDALSGTVAGFRYEPPADEKHLRDVEQFPSPKPVMTDSGRFVAVTDSGRFVGVTDDVWLTDLPEDQDPLAPDGDGSAPHGLVAEGGRAAGDDAGVARRHVIRPKAPEGADSTARSEFPGPPPLPPRAPLRLRFTPFFRKLGRKLRNPLGRWAALLLALGGLGALAVALTSASR